jgi:protein-disulfide isomerase
LDNRYLAAGGVGALMVGVVAAAFFFLTPQAARTQDLPANTTKEQVLALTEFDIGLGDPNAPIKLIEYASSGCGHCAAFTIETLPKIESEWIDKGIVYYVLRDFPLDNVAAAASVIARCLPKERFYPFMDILFRNQQVWHSPETADPKEALIELSRRAGLSREDVESCLKDQSALDRIQKTRDEASNILQVNSTPTMFINGEMIEGAAAYSEFETKFKALQPAQP